VEGGLRKVKYAEQEKSKNENEIISIANWKKKKFANSIRGPGPKISTVLQNTGSEMSNSTTVPKL